MNIVTALELIDCKTQTPEESSAYLAGVVIMIDNIDLYLFVSEMRDVYFSEFVMGETCPQLENNNET